MDGWVKVAEFSDLNFLAVVETRLNDAGIDYFILDEATSTIRPYGLVSARLMVPADQVDDALLLLK